MPVNAAYVSALAALAGSAIGALASVVTSWTSQRVQARMAHCAQDLARREALYSEFIREASCLFADAFEHELEDPAKMVQLYATVSIIRLFGEEATLEEAEEVMCRIGATYFAPNKDLKQFGVSRGRASSIRSTRSARPAAASCACSDETFGGVSHPLSDPRHGGWNHTERQRT